MFTKLLDPDMPATPGEQQLRARRDFPAIVLRSGLHLWHPGEPVVATERRLIVGIATYSLDDLRMLDRLAQRLWAKTQSLRIDVFNTLDCHEQSDFARYIPGLEKVYQTPVVGLWEHGKFVRSGTGLRGREIVRPFMDFA